MNRAQVLGRLDKAWLAFKESFAGLSEAEVLEPNVTGTWSVRDILVHVTTWEEEALKHLPLILEGGKPPRYSVAYGGIDAFNARMTEAKRGLTLSQVLAQNAAVGAQPDLHAGKIRPSPKADQSQCFLTGRSHPR